MVHQQTIYECQPTTMADSLAAAFVSRWSRIQSLVWTVRQQTSNDVSQWYYRLATYRNTDLIFIKMSDVSVYKKHN